MQAGRLSARPCAIYPLLDQVLFEQFGLGAFGGRALMPPCTSAFEHFAAIQPEAIAVRAFRRDQSPTAS